MTFTTNTTDANATAAINSYNVGAGDENELGLTHVSGGDFYMTDAKAAELIYALEDRYILDLDGDTIIGAPSLGTGGFNPYYSRFIGRVGEGASY
jgi:hypothetical protein